MTSLDNRYFLIYKTTNLINGKIYIGKHITDEIDDGYMGSGKLLKYAISKYGIENFTREILFMCSSEEEMDVKEAELVTEEFCLRKDTYNICIGGQGGFSYINKNGLRRNNFKHSNKSKQKTSKSLLEFYKTGADEEFKKQKAQKIKIKNIGKIGGFTNKTHTDETKKKMSESKKVTAKGIKNSQYGTMWITNGIENKKINRNDKVPEGWYPGRVIKNLEV